MISFLQGKVAFSDEDSICLISNGVGWDVNVGNSIEYVIGSNYEIYCYTHFTQDKITLWGVKDIKELTLLRKLVSVSGVGPRTAILLLVSKGVDAISDAILNGDISALKVKGLGEKTLQKIVIELKGKVNLSATLSSKVYSSRLDDIMEAMIKIGYSKIEVMNFLNSKEKQYLDTAEESQIIKDFIKHQ